MNDSDILEENNIIKKDMKELEKLCYNGFERRKDNIEKDLKDFKDEISDEMGNLSNDIVSLRNSGIAAWVFMLSLLIGGMNYSVDKINNNRDEYKSQYSILLSKIDDTLKNVAVNNTNIVYIIKNIDKLEKQKNSK